MTTIGENRDLLLKIFLTFTTKDLYSCRNVCHLWNQIAFSAICRNQYIIVSTTAHWDHLKRRAKSDNLVGTSSPARFRRLLLYVDQGVITSRAAADLLLNDQSHPYYLTGNLTALTMHYNTPNYTNCDDADTRLAEALAELLPSLSYFACDSAYMNDRSRAFWKATLAKRGERRKLPRMRRLHIGQGLQVDTMGRMWSRCPNLTVTSFPMPSRVAVQKLLHGLKSVSTCLISGYEPDSRRLMAIWKTNLSTLEHIHVEVQDAIEEASDQVQPLIPEGAPNLVNISLWFRNISMPLTLVDACRKYPNLKCLRIRTWGFGTYDDHRAKSIPPDLCMPYVTTLFIQAKNFPDMESVLRFAPNVRDLRFGSWKNILLEDLTYLADNAFRLQKLRILHLTKLVHAADISNAASTIERTLRAAARLIQSLPDLRHLKLQYPVDYPDGGDGRDAYLENRAYCTCVAILLRAEMTTHWPSLKDCNGRKFPTNIMKISWETAREDMYLEAHSSDGRDHSNRLALDIFATVVSDTTFWISVENEYPQRKSRILAVIREMGDWRYRQSLSVEDAISHLERRDGHRFDWRFDWGFTDPDIML